MLVFVRPVNQKEKGPKHWFQLSISLSSTLCWRLELFVFEPESVGKWVFNITPVLPTVWQLKGKLKDHKADSSYLFGCSSYRGVYWHGLWFYRAWFNQQMRLSRESFCATEVVTTKLGWAEAFSTNKSLSHHPNADNNIERSIVMFSWHYCLEYTVIVNVSN